MNTHEKNSSRSGCTKKYFGYCVHEKILQNARGLINYFRVLDEHKKLLYHAIYILTQFSLLEEIMLEIIYIKDQGRKRVGSSCYP